MTDVAPFPKVKVFLMAVVDLIGVLPIWRYMPKYPDEMIPPTPEWFFVRHIPEGNRQAHLKRMESFTIEVEAAWRERFRRVKAWENAMDLYMKLVVAGHITGFVLGFLALGLFVLFAT